MSVSSRRCRGHVFVRTQYLVNRLGSKVERTTTENGNEWWVQHVILKDRFLDLIMDHSFSSSRTDFIKDGLRSSSRTDFIKVFSSSRMDFIKDFSIHRRRLSTTT